MNQKLSLSKLQKNTYLQLFIIFGDSKQINKYLNTFFKYHNSIRSQDLYQLSREHLFHANWIGLNNNLFDYLDKLYNESIINLKQNSEIEKSEQNWEEWNQIAQYECDLFLYELNQMYRKNHDLEQFGFNIVELIYVLLSNFDEGSYVHLTVLNKYMTHDIYGSIIRLNISQINLDLWKVRCLGKFDDVILEFIYALKIQYIYALNNNDKTQVRQNINCIQIYLSILKYDFEVIFRLVTLIDYISQIPKDIWNEQFLKQSCRWIPAVNRIYNYRYDIDETFNELFLNSNEQFYFKYPAQILNFKAYPLKLIKIRSYVRMFKILCEYRNQILIFRVINTYLYFSCYCFLRLIQKVLKLPWAKISIYLVFIYFGIKIFKA